ncbi:uncharacterized protein LOC105232386 isoform X5 [Bactrocera dorsalis]|uniref:Uncharacterized protein LOC105232386 isoform X5 n=1 Tax=Bactrocera dorsalis TaxID=27457 RepID=A0ABM3J0J6_BACDO|nr:uncharacterized protein LOC105232386 isoform X5 [Bactrocera dorsalis]
MFKGTTYLVIILLLLIQLVSCLPRSSSSEENAVPSGHNGFEEALSKGLINISNLGLHRTNQIAKDVLADPSMYSIESEAMQEELNLLRKYVIDSKEVLNKVQAADQLSSSTFFLFVKDAQIVGHHLSRFQNFKTDPLTPEQQVTWNALKKHGWLEFREEMHKRVDEYQSNMVDKFEKYVKTLSAAEKEKDKDMKDMMAAWNAYKRNEISKFDFGTILHKINIQNKFIEVLRRP